MHYTTMISTLLLASISIKLISNAYFIFLFFLFQLKLSPKQNKSSLDRTCDRPWFPTMATNRVIMFSKQAFQKIVLIFLYFMNGFVIHYIIQYIQCSKY